MSNWGKNVVQTTARSTNAGRATEFKSEAVRNPHANPVLLFPRRMIDDAVYQAKKTKAGEPPRESLFARQWIAMVTSSTERGFCKHCNRNLPLAFMGSFEWCCHWLDLDVERTRREKLAEIELAWEMARMHIEIQPGMQMPLQFEACFG